LKDAGLKVCYHMMPGLPGANFERDIEAFERVFNDPIFRPDMLKIYPCLVLEGTKIHDWWREGLYRPYSTEEATEFLSLIKTKVPAWVRIMRVQRDIPAQLIVAGVKRSNLRQLIWNYMRDKGLHCHCIRCREVGHRMLVEGVAPRVEDVSTTTTEYEASSGREFFLCVEDQTKDILIGYLRLRLPSTRAHRPEIRDEPTTLVRELYGTTVPVADRVEGAWQHRGYGKALLRRAEEISREQGARKILVTSALGVRQYFRKLGYERMGPYMGRRLN